eukprot:Gb_26853 [translate_table: standard]
MGDLISLPGPLPTSAPAPAHILGGLVCIKGHPGNYTRGINPWFYKLDHVGHFHLNLVSLSEDLLECLANIVALIMQGERPTPKTMSFFHFQMKKQHSTIRSCEDDLKGPYQNKCIMVCSLPQNGQTLEVRPIFLSLATVVKTSWMIDQARKAFTGSMMSTKGFDAKLMHERIRKQYENTIKYDLNGMNKSEFCFELMPELEGGAPDGEAIDRESCSRLVSLLGKELFIGFPSPPTGVEDHSNGRVFLWVYLQNLHLAKAKIVLIILQRTFHTVLGVSYRLNRWCNLPNKFILCVALMVITCTNYFTIMKILPEKLPAYAFKSTDIVEEFLMRI